MASNYSQIGISFVKQYYYVLLTKSPNLVKMYHDDSTFTLSRPDEEEVSASGQQKIFQLLENSVLSGGAADFETGSIISQPTVNNGVFIAVNGLFTFKDGTQTRFAQSFFLRCINSTNYYCVNDCFQFIDTASAPPAVEATPEAEPQPVPAVTSKAPAAPAPAPAAADDAAPANPETVAQPAPVAPAGPQGWETPKTEKENTVPEAPAAAAPEARQKGRRNGRPQKKVAAAANSTKAASAPARSAPASYSAIAAGGGNASQWRQKRPQARSTAAPAATAANQAKGSAAAGTAPSVTGGKSASLYVKIPEKKEVSKAVIDGLFSPFGTIKSIQMPEGKNFLFVEYNEAASAQAAIAAPAGSITLDGAVVTYQPRNENKGGPRNGKANGPRSRRGDGKRRSDSKRRSRGKNTSSAPNNDGWRTK